MCMCIWLVVYLIIDRQSCALFVCVCVDSCVPCKCVRKQVTSKTAPSAAILSRFCPLFKKLIAICPNTVLKPTKAPHDTCMCEDVASSQQALVDLVQVLLQGAFGMCVLGVQGENKHHTEARHTCDIHVLRNAYFSGKPTGMPAHIQSLKHVGFLGWHLGMAGVG
eukprot:12230900-Alexandrium_andersonii.AAC.1